MTMLKSYLRTFGATCLVALLAIGKTPLEFTPENWLNVANAVWISFIPVLIRALDSKDSAFGKGVKKG